MICFVMIQKKMWRENMKQMDEKFKIWSNAPEDPQNN